MKQIVSKAIESSMVRVLTTWTLLISCILCAFLYAYWINKAIFEAVQTKQITAAVSELSSDLNALQQKYLSLQNSATLAKARELGFSESDTPIFISRRPLGQGISLRSDI